MQNVCKIVIAMKSDKNERRGPALSERKGNDKAGQPQLDSSEASHTACQLSFTPSNAKRPFIG